MACPLLEGIDLSGARGVLVLIAAGKSNFKLSGKIGGPSLCPGGWTLDTANPAGNWLYLDATTEDHEHGGVLMSGLSGLGHRLYAGEVSIDFVGRRKTWYIVSAIILIVAVGALVFRGLNLGIEFRGGAEFAIPSATCTVEEARTVAEDATGAQAIVTSTKSGIVRVQTESLTAAESSALVCRSAATASSLRAR